MLCLIEGCDKPHLAKGMCAAHYNRVRRHGGVERVRLPQDGTCSRSGCENPSHAKGLCAAHYQQHQPPLHAIWKLLRSRAKGMFPPAWKDFDAFCIDVGDRPSEAHQLRRIDKTQPWGIGNFVWLEPIGVSFSGDGPYYQWVWNLRNTYDLSPDDCDLARTDHRQPEGPLPSLLSAIGLFRSYNTQGSHRSH